MDSSARHLKPWHRGPYLLGLIGAVLPLLLVALGVLASVDLAWMCPVFSGLGSALLAVTPAPLWRRWGCAGEQATQEAKGAALAAMREGRYEEAARIWDGLCHDTRRVPALHAFYVHSLGMAWLHQGRLEEARALVERARSSGWIGLFAFVPSGPSTLVDRALSLALAGELDAAHREITSLRLRLLQPHRGRTMLVEAVIAARVGKPVQLDEAILRDAEAALIPPHVRALRLLEAFTSARSGGAYREGDAVTATGIRPGELDFLAARWPELRAFMAARGLLAERNDRPSSNAPVRARVIDEEAQDAVEEERRLHAGRRSNDRPG